MSRYTGPKTKLARKIGEDLSLKSNPMKVAKRLGIFPGQHGKKQKKKMSDYGIQLREKQKLRFMYGLTEKQLRKAYADATKTPTSTGAALLKILERRLDNVLYRMKFAPTRASARQLVNHGHVTVNGKKMDVASYLVEVDDQVQLKDSGTKIPAIAESMKDSATAAQWVTVKGAIGKITRFANRDEIDSGINEQLIVEWYSR